MTCSWRIVLQTLYRQAPYIFMTHKVLKSKMATWAHDVCDVHGASSAGKVLLYMYIYRVFNAWGMGPQSFLYENHSECYRKHPSRSWPVLFTLTYFWFLHTLFYSKIKVVAIVVFLRKLYHRPLFSYICFKIIVVWRMVIPC